jgi:hypothetical protein
MPQHKGPFDATLECAPIPRPSRTMPGEAWPMTKMKQGYESDVTRFIRELKTKRPDLERKQREGRAIWWDKELDFDELQRREQARVPQPPYAYYTNF